MLNTTTFNCKSPGLGTYKKLYALGYKAFLSFVILFTLFLSNSANAQTVRQSLLTCPAGSRDACSSNDLQVVSVDITSSGCISCSGTETVTLPLTMTIHNGTGSVRTSFCLYGTLSNGASITAGGVTYSGNIFICVGPVTVTSGQDIGFGLGNQQFAVGNITFTCGQDLTLTNNFLKWTDASGSTVPRCEELALKTSCLNGPDGIGPKCGFAASIVINGPVPQPQLVQTDPTCTVSTGKLELLSTFNRTGLTFSLDGGAFGDYPTGGWGGLTPGEHCIRAKRTSDGCISAPKCLTIGNAPANPDPPTVCIVQPTLCGSATGSAKITAPIATGNQYSKDDGTTWQDCNVFLNLAAGSNPTFRVKTAAGCISGPTTCASATTCSETPTDCPATVNKPAVQTIELAAPKTKVLAAPNPFTNRVQFKIESAVSGMGSLELYNTMGQKVATVYQGYVEAGKPLNKEYMVKSVSRSSLIYVFRVGDQKVTGKLLNW